MYDEVDPPIQINDLVKTQFGPNVCDIYVYGYVTGLYDGLVEITPENLKAQALTVPTDALRYSAEETGGACWYIF